MMPSTSIVHTSRQSCNGMTGFNRCGVGAYDVSLIAIKSKIVFGNICRPRPSAYILSTGIPSLVFNRN